MMQEPECGPREMKRPDGFITYEHLRSDGGGGGLAIWARSILNPVLVRKMEARK